MSPVVLGLARTSRPPPHLEPIRSKKDRPSFCPHIFFIASFFFLIPSSPALPVADEPARWSIRISDWLDPPVGPAVLTCHWMEQQQHLVVMILRETNCLHIDFVLQKKKRKKKRRTGWRTKRWWGRKRRKRRGRKLRDVQVRCVKAFLPAALISSLAADYLQPFHFPLRPSLPLSSCPPPLFHLFPRAVS